jgi:uncharacterized protein (DUF1501 family)
MQKSAHETVSRRDYLRAGALALGSLGLADILRLQAAADSARPQPRKSVIMIHLLGGPIHIDMYDMKPDAPAEYRGDFLPTASNVPGMEICELMPQQAQIADKLAIVRGIRFCGAHDTYQLLSGYRERPVTTGKVGKNPRPAFGSVVSKLWGEQVRSIPPYVSLGDLRLLAGYDEIETPAWLGPAHSPFRIDGPGHENLTLNGITPERFRDRQSMMRTLDLIRRQADVAYEDVRAADHFQAQALELLASTRTLDAFDISQESQSVRDSYGGYDEFLRARRLVEAGVPVVTLPARFPVRVNGAPDPGGWDTHAYNFKLLKEKLPRYDHAIAALINDLSQRGLLDDTAIVVWGEFGRRPKIGNVTPDGRSHWPAAGFALLAGGGLKTGQVVGETDRLGEASTGRPFVPSNILATLYHTLGISLRQTLPDHAGRPQFLLDEREPLRQLL